MTSQELIECELDRPGIHEFFRGEVSKVFGDEGARREHVAAMENIGAALHRHLHGTASQPQLQHIA